MRSIFKISAGRVLAFLAMVSATVSQSPNVSVTYAQAQTVMANKDSPAFTVRFIGGDVPGNAATVLDILNQVGSFRIKQTRVTSGETPCEIYKELIAFPGGCPGQLVSVVSNLNNHRDFNKNPLQIGDTLNYPDVWFVQLQASRYFDLTSATDRVALDDIHRKSSGSVLGETKLPNGQTKVSLGAYELRVSMPSGSDADNAERALVAARLKDVTFNHSENQKRGAKDHSVVSPVTYLRDCSSGLWHDGEGCAYSLLFGLTTLGNGPCQGKCPDVFLLDKPVFRNPSLVKAVKDGFAPSDESNLSVTSSLCALPPLTDQQHGTHLAGVIGSSGPTCTGINTDARIHSWNRDADFTGIATDIEDAQDRHDSQAETVGLPIFVYAGSWTYSDAQREGSQLKTLESRFQHPLAAEIQSHGALWIVSAGQVDDRDRHIYEITPRLAMGPMNLGDQQNVLVVSACTGCGTDQPELRNGVYFSPQFVHVAAPGDDVPGPAGVDRLAVGGGTSQAAAFAAGVASAMVGRYPVALDRPEFVKARLQFTSRPVLSGDDANRVATGIIDPVAAMLDPGANFIKKRGGEFQAVSVDGWCMSSFQVVNPDTGRLLQDGTILSRDVYRLYRTNRDVADGRSVWMLYTRFSYDSSAQHTGEVRRIGPARIVIAGDLDGTKPLFRESGGANRRGTPGGELDDLLFHPGLGVVQCSQ